MRLIDADLFMATLTDWINRIRLDGEGSKLSEEQTAYYHGFMHGLSTAKSLLHFAPDAEVEASVHSNEREEENDDT